LEEQRDLAVTTDSRLVLGEIVACCVRLDLVFPGFTVGVKSPYLGLHG